MPIDVLDPLKPPAVTPPPAVDLTVLRQTKTAEAVADAVARGYRGVVATHNELMAQLWANPLALTPTQAAAAMGTRGAALLMLAGKVREIAALIASQTGRDPTADLTAPTPGWAMAPGEDGSLALTPPPPEADDGAAGPAHGVQ